MGMKPLRHATYRPKPGPLSQRLQKCASAIDSAVFALQITSNVIFIYIYLYIYMPNYANTGFLLALMKSRTNGK